MQDAARTGGVRRRGGNLHSIRFVLGRHGRTPAATQEELKITTPFNIWPLSTSQGGAAGQESIRDERVINMESETTGF